MNHLSERRKWKYPYPLLSRTTYEIPLSLRVLFCDTSFLKKTKTKTKKPETSAYVFYDHLVISYHGFGSTCLAEYVGPNRGMQGWIASKYQRNSHKTPIKLSYVIDLSVDSSSVVFNAVVETVILKKGNHHINESFYMD